MKKLTAAVMGIALVLALAACGMPPAPDPDPDPEPQSIAAIATEAGIFETLLSILPEDLAAALSDDEAGPFTVFAPTDDAFAAISEVLPTLTDEEVREVLELHVIDGAVSSTDAIDAVSARSLGSELLFFIVDGDDLLVDGYALVESADVQASNGVIHVIDAVLLPKNTIAGEAVERSTGEQPEFTTLVDAIVAANAAVFDTLDDVEAGPFTVFAPTDAAFAALPAGALEGLLDDQAALTNVLLYHATDAGALVASQVVSLVSEGPVEVEMLNGDDVTVALENGSVKVNDATVVITDVLTANGVIHVIDAVLLPPVDPDPEPQSIAAIAAEAGIFETLLSILPEDLAAALSTDEAGPFTVFAPTDDAFAAIADVLPTLSDEQVRDVLELHVIGAAVSSTEAIDAVSARSLGSELLFFIVDGDDLLVDGVALVEAADIEASNGVIHVIDRVLLPKGTIADVAVGFTTADPPEFTTLVTAIQAADALVFDTLADVEAGPFTVFAPTDAAFAALPDGALAGLLDDQAALTNVLLYHLTEAGALVASQVVALVSEGPVEVEMLNDDDVTVALENGAVKVNDATVVITDVLTANGVIHVIDAVLLPTE